MAEADADDNVTFRPAWQRSDPQIVAEVKRLWEAEGLPPSLTQGRESEICAVAYSGDELIAVSTVNLYYDPMMRNNMFAFRCMTATHFRQHNMAWRIGSYTKRILQEWCAQHPEERALGLMTVFETGKFAVGARPPVREKFGITMHFVGYSEAGQQLRVIWFDDAMLDDSAVKHKGLPAGKI